MNIALELHNTTGKGLIEILVNQKYVDEQCKSSYTYETVLKSKEG